MAVRRGPPERRTSNMDLLQLTRGDRRHYDCNATPIGFYTCHHIVREGAEEGRPEIPRARRAGGGEFIGNPKFVLADSDRLIGL